MDNRLSSAIELLGEGDPPQEKLRNLFHHSFDFSTLIHQILTLMHLKNDIREIPKMIHIHPALPELFLDSAVDAIKKARDYQKN